MGNNVTKTQTTFDTSIIQSTINDVNQQIKQKIDTTASCVAGDVVTIGGDVILKGNCKFTITNLCKSTVTQLADITASQVSQVVDEQSDKLQNNITKQIAQKNEQLNLFQSNVVEDSTKLTNNIKNEIKNSINQNITQLNKTYDKASGVITFETGGNFLCQDDAELTIDNEVFLDLFQQSNTDAIMDTIVSNLQQNDVLDKYDLKVTQTNEGVNLVGLIVAVTILLLVMFLPTAFGSTTPIKVLSPILFLASVAAFIYFYTVTGSEFLAVSSLVIMWGVLVTLITTNSVSSGSK